MISFALTRYVLTAARRDKLLWVFMAMIGVAASVAVFMGSSAITEEDSFTLVYSAGAMRFLGVLGLVLFVCFYIRRAFETREVEFLLARPITRIAFILSHSVAFIVVALFAVALITTGLFLTSKPDMLGLLLWGYSLFIEFSLMAMTALFFAMVLNSAAATALITLCFYTLSRMIGVLLGIADTPPTNILTLILGRLMEFISIIIPRLDMMGETSWLVYGVKNAAVLKFLPEASNYARSMIEVMGQAGFVTVQGIIFLCLILAATAYDFYRREF